MFYKHYCKPGEDYFQDIICLDNNPTVDFMNNALLYCDRFESIALHSIIYTMRSNITLVHELRYFYLVICLQ